VNEYWSQCQCKYVILNMRENKCNEENSEWKWRKVIWKTNDRKRENEGNNDMQWYYECILMKWFNIMKI